MSVRLVRGRVVLGVGSPRGEARERTTLRRGSLVESREVVRSLSASTLRLRRAVACSRGLEFVSLFSKRGLVVARCLGCMMLGVVVEGSASHKAIQTSVKLRQRLSARRRRTRDGVLLLVTVDTTEAPSSASSSDKERSSTP